MVYCRLHSNYVVISSIHVYIYILGRYILLLLLYNNNTELYPISILITKFLSCFSPKFHYPKTINLSPQVRKSLGRQNRNDYNVLVILHIRHTINILTHVYNSLSVFPYIISSTIYI